MIQINTSIKQNKQKEESDVDETVSDLILYDAVDPKNDVFEIGKIDIDNSK